MKSHGVDDELRFDKLPRLEQHFRHERMMMRITYDFYKDQWVFDGYSDVSRGKATTIRNNSLIGLLSELVKTYVK